MNEPRKVAFQWLAAESVAPAVVDALTDSGTAPGSTQCGPAPAHLLSDTDDAGFEPLLLIAGAAGIAHLARAISRIVRDHRQGGVVIDTRGEAVMIRGGVRGVDAGTVLVVNVDGSQMLNPPEEGMLLKLLEP